MAAFRDSDLNYHDEQGQQRQRLDWALLQNGPISLFHQRQVVAASVQWLKEHSYVIAEADCGFCDSEKAVLSTIGRALGFPEWPNPGLDGFNDNCSNIEVPDDGGYALVLHRFDQVAKKRVSKIRVPGYRSPWFRSVAEEVLGILADASRGHLLFGRRFLCLVQSDNPQIHFGPVGGLVSFRLLRANR